MQNEPAKDIFADWPVLDNKRIFISQNNTTFISIAFCTFHGIEDLYKNAYSIVGIWKWVFRNSIPVAVSRINRLKYSFLRIVFMPNINYDTFKYIAK